MKCWPKTILLPKIKCFKIFLLNLKSWFRSRPKPCFLLAVNKLNKSLINFNDFFLIFICKIRMLIKIICKSSLINKYFRFSVFYRCSWKTQRLTVFLDWGEKCMSKSRVLSKVRWCNLGTDYVGAEQNGLIL